MKKLLIASIILAVFLATFLSILFTKSANAETYDIELKELTVPNNRTISVVAKHAFSGRFTNVSLHFYWILSNGREVQAGIRAIPILESREQRVLLQPSQDRPANATGVHVVSYADGRRNSEIREIFWRTTPTPTPTPTLLTPTPSPSEYRVGLRDMRVTPSTITVMAYRSGASPYNRVGVQFYWILRNDQVHPSVIDTVYGLSNRYTEILVFSKPRPPDVIGVLAKIIDHYSDRTPEDNSIRGYYTSPTPTLTPTPTPTPKSSKASKQNLTYPIKDKELGNCKSKTDCKKYCDLKENTKKCLEYGAKTGLMSQAEVAVAEAVTETTNGPGGCTDKESCAKVCDDPANSKVCLDFAQENNLMSSDELEKAKKVMGIISTGGKTPGGCSTPQACKAYCSGGAHVDECIEFAKGAGLISGEEAKEMERGRDFLKNGGPGGCKSREECESYCENDDHQAECEVFFKNAGVPDAKSKDKSGKPPKTGGGAVCKTRDECEAFCKNPANAEACKNVVIKQDSSSSPETGGDLLALLGNINQMPEESKECLKQALGTEIFGKLTKGEMPTTPINDDVMQSCFAKGVEEYEQKAMPTKKPDDFSLEYGPGPGYTFNSEGTVVPQDTNNTPENTPGGVSEVQGISTIRSILDVVLGWFRK